MYSIVSALTPSGARVWGCCSVVEGAGGDAASVRRGSCASVQTNGPEEDRRSENHSSFVTIDEY
jgi:hypothetical protein